MPTVFIHTSHYQARPSADGGSASNVSAAVPNVPVPGPRWGPVEWITIYPQDDLDLDEDEKSDDDITIALSQDVRPYRVHVRTGEKVYLK